MGERMSVNDLTILALRLGRIRLALTLRLGQSGAEPVITASLSKKKSTKTTSDARPSLQLPAPSNDNSGVKG